MDTKSKKFKYSIFAKFLCFLLILVCFFTGAMNAFTFIASCELFGPSDYLENNKKTFFELNAVNHKLYTHGNSVTELANTNINSEPDDVRKEKIEEAVSAFLDKKANIIQAELQYAVDNYDDSYFNYEYTADAVDIPDGYEPTTIEGGTAVTTSADDDNDVPRNIEAAQKILKQTTGRGFLKYEALVREDAFRDDFTYTTQNSETETDYYTTEIMMTVGLDSSEEQVRKLFVSQYNENYNYAYDSYTKNTNNAYNTISTLTNFKFYAAAADNQVYTNQDKTTPLSEKEVKAHSVYAYFDGKQVSLKGIKVKSVEQALQSNFVNHTGTPMYFYLEELQDGSFPYTDEYSLLLDSYKEMVNTSPKTIIAYTVVFMIAALAFLIMFMCICGHKKGEEKPVEAFIDKMPPDLHFIVSGGIMAVLTALIAELMYIDSMHSSTITGFYMILLASFAATGFCAVFTEWLASVVRIKKCSGSIYENTLLKKIVDLIRKLAVIIVSAVAYKHKHIKRTSIILLVLYILGNTIISLFLCEIIPIMVLLLVIYNAAWFIGTLKYLNTLDKIITASSKHENIILNQSKTPRSLKILAENLTNTSEELDRAVTKAVRDEQLKTELITNVSHDLKTPLTSLITYSDILKKCNITDPQALKYVGVINEQSIKLKRLIEDLIEASKVSSGNVTLNKSMLNLSEIAAQAIVEFEPEMEKNGNEIRFSEPEKAPTVFADGSKTYRIISNLLSNAKKYSAPDTRVYISIYNDESNGYFEIKNVSGEPLNISPDELTERFVRGDKSRAKEGNGLGLSIAKDLCELQDGELKIFIDGDLFKAIVQLPSCSDMQTRSDELPKLITDNDPEEIIKNYVSEEPNGEEE